ncbi:hypothetical protein AB0395_10090 [Streptosporangium sp. NPDC051023]|uniref:hypothetical protein n=1 Tax=Streptosporangium sp. NPDC051023 TaxID=3155410 RepID=UPI00344C97E2
MDPDPGIAAVVDACPSMDGGDLVASHRYPGTVRGFGVMPAPISAEAGGARAGALLRSPRVSVRQGVTV